MVDQAMIERVAAAIDSADVGFNMKLTRLVDGIHTYELKMDGKVEEFDNTDDLYIRVREIKQRKQAEAVIAALSPAPSELSVVSPGYRLSHWKDGSDELETALDAFWNAAYQQGQQQRGHDDEQGSAQAADTNLRHIIAKMAAPAEQRPVSDLDIQIAYEAWLDRTMGARAPITAFYAGYRAAHAAPAPAELSVGSERLRELLKLIDAMPRTDRGFSWEARDWQGNEAIRAYGNNAAVLKFIIDNTDALAVALRAALSASEVEG